MAIEHVILPGQQLLPLEVNASWNAIAGVLLRVHLSGQPVELGGRKERRHQAVEGVC